MSIKNFSIVIVFLSQSLFAQYIDPSNIKFYDYNPASEIYLGGIGSLGFNSELNFYNPNYLNAKSVFEIGVYGSASLYSSRYFYKNHPLQENKTSLGRFYLVPNIFVQYRCGTYLFGLEFYNNLLFNRDIEQPKQLTLGTPSGTFTLDTDGANLKIKNEVLQFFISKNFWKNTAITVGLLTNSFSFKLKNIDSEYKLYSNLFTNQQVFLSFNYTDTSEFSGYALYKSQLTETSLDPKQININNYITERNWTEINYFSYLGYGLQANQLMPLKFSIEFFHKFLLKNVKTEKMNTTVVLGINYLLDKILLGGAFLYPIKIDPFVNESPWGLTTIYPSNRTDKVFSFLFNSSYKIDNAKIFLNYQFSKLGASEVYNDYANYLTLGLIWEIIK